MTTFTKDAVTTLSNNLGEPAWMRDFRARAWTLFEELPLPTTSDEAWRRTTLRRLKLDNVNVSVNGQMGAAPADFEDLLNAHDTAGTLAFVDGALTGSTLDEAISAQGVIFCDMSAAVRDYPALVQQHFMTRAVPPEDGKFAALHAAFWKGGAFLYVPANVVVDKPFRTSLWSNGHTATHTLVVLESGARATLIEEYASQTGEEMALHNGAVELLVGDGADLVYGSLQDFGTNVWQFNHERGRVGRDGRLDWVISVMGTRLTKAFQTVELDGEGSWARMSGLFFGDGHQHFDLDTQQNHNAANTISDLLYKGALKGRARSVWQGMIKALPGSQKIDGFQANRNLLLEKSARADSIPGLEIEADDVVCTHASTIGKIDTEEVFYLQARGIPLETAIEMVVQGFFDPIMSRIPIESIRDHIAERIVEKVR